jgi:hypothetical protein
VVEFPPRICQLYSDLKAPSLETSLLQGVANSPIHITDNAGSVYLSLSSSINTFSNGVIAPSLKVEDTAINTTLTVDTASGVTINTGAFVANNLSVGGALVVGTTNNLTGITDLQNSSGSVDLSNYYTRPDTDFLSAKQNTLNESSSLITNSLETDQGIRSRRGLTLNTGTADRSDLIWGTRSSSNWNIFSYGPALEFWRLVNGVFRAFQINAQGYVVFYGGANAASDRILKDNIQDMPENDAVNLLKNVSAKTYTRKDMTNNKIKGRIYCSRF